MSKRLSEELQYHISSGMISIEEFNTNFKSVVWDINWGYLSHVDNNSVTKSNFRRGFPMKNWVFI